MKALRFILSSVALAGLLFSGCGDDSTPTDAGGDTGGGDTSTDSSPPDDTSMDTTPPGACVRYCDALDANCSTVPQYNDRAECEAYCAASGWDEGMPDDMSGNTIECRIYHAGAPAAADPDMHCPHAGPSGGQVCGGVDYRTEAADTFTRVDRSGMPAVSTALIGTDSKNAYNDDNPAGDAMLTYVPEIAVQLTALHDALDDDLTGMSLVPCSMTDLIGSLPECVGQPIAPGSSTTVASLVVPDTLQIDGTMDAGFPNGRLLGDQVMDVTLAIILLDLSVAGQTPGSFAALPLNPGMNDRPFATEFPYLADPHTP